MLHTIQNAFLAVTVSEQGAELQSILGSDGTEYLWQGDPAYWTDRAPNIFPYVARLTQGSYYLDGVLYHMNIHGIALYSRFRRVSNDGVKLVMELTDDESTYQKYPRRFSFQVIYTLEKDTLSITFRIENRDEKVMYFGIGGHPGFRVPLAEGLRFEDYQLRFHAPCQPKRVGFTEDCFLNGQSEPYPLQQDRYLPLRHDLFDDDAIVLNDMARAVTLESDSDSHSITVSFPDMPYLGIWHMPRTDAPYVCIEPWSSLPSTKNQIAVLEQQPDLLTLAPGKNLENTWTIQLR